MLKNMAVTHGGVVIQLLLLTSSFKQSRTITTYFGRLNEDGILIDRSSPEYNTEIESKPRINNISDEDAKAIKFETWPSVIKNGENVTILWTGVENPQAKDYIAYYCPFDDDTDHYLDYIWLKDVPGWENGYAHYDLVVYNMREACVFKYYRSTNTSYVLAAISNKVNFSDGGPQAPLQGHLAMTNEPTEMRVMWTSANLTKPPIVRYGETEKLGMEETNHVMHTYTNDSMCDSPANATGFWHPGYVYDVLLKNLKPNTRYYYSYGTDEYMSHIVNFTSPIPKGVETPYRFIIYGDMGVGSLAHITARNVRQDIIAHNISFVLHHGDISYAQGYAYVWEEWFWLTEPYATLLPYMVGIGNHEYDYTGGGIGHDPSNVSTDDGWHPPWFNGHNDSGGECGVPMVKRYHMPENGNSLFWYSFDYGMVHMIMMSTEHDFSPGSIQYQWIESDMEKVNRTETPWLFLIGHRAMYNSEKNYSNDNAVGTYMQELLETLLYKHNVDIAFWAHYHSYERTCKMYKSTCVDDGIMHIIVGTGGESLAIDEWYENKWSLFHKAALGYGRVSIASSSALLYEWIENVDNEVTDGVWLYK